MTESHFALNLDADVTAPGTARHRAAAWLTARGVHPDVVQDVLVVVSELVTNAVIHARSPSSCVVSISAGTIRVEVADADPSPPEPAPPQPVGGLGLRIVERLATRWQWQPGPAGGKVVWAELPAHLR